MVMLVDAVPLPAVPSCERLPARVVYLTNFISPHVAPLLRELAERVDSLTILVSTPMEGDRQWRPDWDGLDVRVQQTISLPNFSRHRLGFRLSNYRHLPLDTFRQLRRLRPDVIFSSEMGFRSLLSAAYARAWRRTPLVLGCSLSEHTEQGLSWWKRIVRRGLLGCADQVVTSGTSGLRYLESLGVPRERLSLYPYVAPPRFHAERRNPEDCGPIRKLLYVGQLNARKGILAFVEQLGAWLQSRPQVELELALAGEGEQRGALEALALPPNLRLTLLGNRQAAELVEWYAQADLFVFPTLADEWGLVVDEAMWLGTPVLGSVLAQSVSDLVREGETGWRYDPLQPGDLERALARVFECPLPQLRTMRQNAYETVRERTPAFAAQRFIEAARAALAHA
jgi:glycosyltransferase involved in cell wall biosynthesis